MNFGVQRFKLLFSVLIFLLSTTVVLAQECGIIFVTPNGAGSGAAGTRANPASLDYGLTLANSANNVMWLAMGTYQVTQTIQIPSDVTIEGGFDPGNNWIKSNATPTILAKDASNVIPAPANALVGIAGLNVSNFRLQDLTITVPDATTPAGSVYGIYLNGCSDYNIVRCEVTTGAGAAGAPGQPGQAGQPGAPGAPGNPAGTEANVPQGGAGGAGGSAGGNGGSGGKHSTFWAPAYGQAGQPSGCGGAGGNPGNGPDCGCGLFGTSNNSSCSGTSPTAGSVGGNGAAGTQGTQGPAGTIQGGYFIPGAAGGNGTAGGPGCGGGGGGGGGGRQQDGPDDVGGSGGGGGGGGYGGGGGTGGTGGGSSFAVFIDNNGAGGNIIDCSLNPGAAGAGGTGGAGGAGGTGGAGGAGGNGFCGGMSNGSAGGAGGAGGQGGTGGDGAPGMSVALQENGGSPVASSGITAVPGNPPVIAVQNGGCTNASIIFTAPTSGAWDFGSGAVPATGNGSGPIAVSYPTVGRRIITFSGTAFTDFIGIYNDGPTLPSITPANPTVDVGCPNEFTTSLTGTNYDWYFGPNAIPPVVTGPNEQTVSDVIFIAPGIYTVYVRVMTACCGEVLDSTVVTVNQSNLEVELTADASAICDGDDITFTADGSHAAYSFFVNGSEEQTGPSNVYSTNTLQNGDSIFVIALAGTCFTNPSDTIIQVVNPIPTVTLVSDDPDNEICQGDQVTFTASPAGMDNYEFFDGSTSLQSGASEILITTGLLPNNSITVVATDAGCESAPSTAIVTVVNPAPMPDLGSSDVNDSICEGDNITFTATPSGQANYEFFEDGSSVQSGASNIYSPANLNSGTSIWVVATSSVGCVSPNSDTITTIVSPYPTVTLASSDPDDEICEGELVTFTATPSGLDQYDFFDNASLVQSGSSNTWATALLATGNSITVVPTNLGCTGAPSSAIVTTVIASPTVNAGVDIANCVDDDDVTLSGFTPSGGTWTGTGITDPNGTFSPSTAGVGLHELYYAVSNANCTTTDTVIATVNGLPPVNAGDDRVICFGETVPLLGDGALSYVWSPTNGLSNPNAASTNAAPDSTTTYTLTGTDTNACVNTDMLIVTVEPVPVIDFTTQDVCCIGDTMIFTNLTIPTTGVTYTWEFGDDSTSTEVEPVHYYEESGTYDVTLTAVLGNCSAMETDQVIVHPRPIAAFIATPETTTFLEPEISFFDGSTNAVQWYWDFADSTNSAETNPVHFYEDTGNYNVMMVATNQFGCTDTTYGEIRITPYTTIYVPSSFTPNGDQINDVFYAYGTDFYNFEMRIFNRWGDQIFFTKDINIGWDGRDGTYQQVPAGVYNYRVIVEDEHFRKHSYMGKIVLYR